MRRRRDVRLLVAGDEGVGKSTLVTALLTETFTEEVPHIIPEISIPPSVSPDGVSTTIVDSSARPEDRPELERQIRLAHVICLMYIADNSNSLLKISSHWLPYLRSLGVNVPVVLVGSKIDLRHSTGGDLGEEDFSNENFEDEILPIMNDFKEVETCVECSSKALINVPEVFFFAQKSVLHPTGPLYDSREQNLKPGCVAALTRIFKLIDTNKDGLVDDLELNIFQLKCFGQPLQKTELDAIKNLVKDDSSSGAKSSKIKMTAKISPKLASESKKLDEKDSEGLTVAGFLHLHKLFIQRGRLETTWTVLRTFGYDDDMHLGNDFLYPKFDVPADSRVELSSVGYQFFTELFSKFDRDHDGSLDTNALDELFSTSCEAQKNPWIVLGFPETSIMTEKDGAITLQSFLAHWSMTTLLDPQITLAYLAYLGFPGSDTRHALRVVRSRTSKERQRRDVFLVLVVGAVGSGKVVFYSNIDHIDQLEITIGTCIRSIQKLFFTPSLEISKITFLISKTEFFNVLKTYATTDLNIFKLVPSSTHNH